MMEHSATVVEHCARELGLRSKGTECDPYQMQFVVTLVK